jgi:hypothetical protein
MSVCESEVVFDPKASLPAKGFASLSD